MMTTKRTAGEQPPSVTEEAARPWTLDDVDSSYIVIRDNDPLEDPTTYVASVFGRNTEQRQERARLIVTAVNNHDALVSFVRYVRDFYQQNFDVMPVAFQTVDSEAERMLAEVDAAACRE